MMVGCGELYFVANAVRLGASALEVGLLVSLPLAIGAAGPLATLGALSRLRHRRSWTVAAALTQALVLLSLAGADWIGWLTVPLHILASCLYQICGMAAGTSWGSWYGDLVPEAVRGRFFALRSRVVQIATCSSVVGGGLVLHFLEPGKAGEVGAGSGGTGFQLLFLTAATLRIVSATLLLLSPEPSFQGLSKPRQVFRYLQTERGQTAWRLLLVGACFQLVTYIGSPYFTPFMLERLELSYLEYMLATVALVAGKFLLLPAWGRAIDAFGPRIPYLLAAMMAALVPLPWLGATGVLWAIGAQVFSGASWSGYELSYFSLLLERSYRRTRPQVFAAQNVLNGSAQLIGGVLGGLLLAATGERFRLVFLLSASLRLFIAVLAPGQTGASRDSEIGRRQLVWRMIGFRPSGGMVHRPIEVPQAARGDDKPAGS